MTKTPIKKINLALQGVGENFIHIGKRPTVDLHSEFLDIGAEQEHVSEEAFIPQRLKVAE